MAETWLARRWCPQCRRGIYTLIAYTSRRLPHGQPPEACQCVRRTIDGEPVVPWWRRLFRRGDHVLSGGYRGL